MAMPIQIESQRRMAAGGRRVFGVVLFLFWFRSFVFRALALELKSQVARGVLFCVLHVDLGVLCALVFLLPIPLSQLVA
jgi:hypothetical protein